MWALPSNDEILSQINHENMITLKMIKKTHRQHFRLYNCNLLLAENLKSCYRILRSCHDLKKVELQYCQIDDRTMGILLKALANLPDLLYLGGYVQQFRRRRQRASSIEQRAPAPSTTIHLFAETMLDEILAPFP